MKTKTAVCGCPVLFDVGQECEQCRTKKVECADCQTEYPKDEMHEKDDGSLICTLCRDSYVYCNECGDLTPDSDATSLHNGDLYCQDCLDNHAFCCDHCADWYDSDERREDPSGVLCCESCFASEYTYCEYCDEIVSVHDDCDCQRGGYGIHDYGYQPNPEFQQVPGEKTQEFFGVELEVLPDGGDNEDLVDRLDHLPVYLKEDGSIPEGVEIVTHPLSYNWIVKSGIFDDIAGALGDFESDDTLKCGMHIHVSKKAFTTFHLYKMLHFVYSEANRDFMIGISQREEDQLIEWCSFRVYDPPKTLAKDWNSERYNAVNLQNRNTVEFRFFNGTCFKNIMLKNIQFTKALIEFSRDNKPSDMTVAKFRDYVESKKKEYSYLHPFMTAMSC